MKRWKLEYLIYNYKLCVRPCVHPTTFWERFLWRNRSQRFSMAEPALVFLFFFFSPFPGELPKVNTRVFFLFFPRPYPAGYPCMFSLGIFQWIFFTNSIIKKKRLLCAFVCPSWFKETGGLHSVRRAQAPINELWWRGLRVTWTKFWLNIFWRC